MNPVVRGAITATSGLAFAAFGSVFAVMIPLIMTSQGKVGDGGIFGWVLAFCALLALYVGWRGRGLRASAGDAAYGGFRTGVWGVVAVFWTLIAGAIAWEAWTMGMAAILAEWWAATVLVALPAMLALVLGRVGAAAPEAIAPGHGPSPWVPDALAPAVAARPGAVAIGWLLAGHVAATVVASFALGPLAALAGTAAYVALVPWLFLALGLLYPLPAWWWLGAGWRVPAFLALPALGAFGLALAGAWPHSATTLLSWAFPLAHALALVAVRRAARDRAAHLDPAAGPAPPRFRRRRVGVAFAFGCWLLYVSMFSEPALRAAVVHDALRPGFPAAELPALLRAAGPWYTGRAAGPDERGVSFRTWMVPPGMYGDVADRPYVDRRAYEAALDAQAEGFRRTRGLWMNFNGFGFAKMAFEAEFGPDGRCTKVGPVSNVD